MIVRFGIDSDYLDTTSLDDVPCPRCGAIPLKVEHTSHYFHLYGLPFVPTGRQAEVVCFACAARFRQRVLPADIAAKVVTARRAIRTPLRMYGGLCILLLIVAVGVFLTWRGVAASDEYADAPRVKDVYVVRTVADGQLITAILRIRGIEGESVIMEAGRDVYPDEMAAHMAIGSGVADRDDTFGEVFTMSRGKLRKLRADGQVLDIIRPGG